MRDGTATRAAAPAAAEVTRIGFAPIVRVDAERREIELCATSEALDTYGTVFAYEASRDAFDRWAGNVREMHERRAVGRRVAVAHDDAARKVYVRVRISKARAQDTGGGGAWLRLPVAAAFAASGIARQRLWLWDAIGCVGPCSSGDGNGACLPG